MAHGAAPCSSAVAVLHAVAILQAVRLCHSFDLRVAKGHHQRGYGFVRLSVIGEGLAEEAPTPGGWQWEQPFQRRWTAKSLRSKIVPVPANGTQLRIGGKDISLRLPQPGAGTTGFFVSDVCFTSRSGADCPNGRRFKVLDRLVEVVNTLMESDEFDFWGMLGDNFYDRDGQLSSEFFNRLTLKAKSKPFITVPGEHDFWLDGAPPGNLSDQLGFGHMQFYGQDTVASQREDGRPCDFSGGHGLQPAEAENFIFGTQLGDMAFFGFAGNYAWERVEPHAWSFCSFVGLTNSIRTVAILGHWSTAENGCEAQMSVRSVYDRMKDMEGCGEKRMLYFMGHEHCNRAVWTHPFSASGHDSGPLGTVGFILGGAGMRGSGCSEFGFTVVQSDPDAKGGPNVRVDHFPIAWDVLDMSGRARVTERYDWLMECLKARGYAGCRAQHGLSFRATSQDDIVSPKTTAKPTTRSVTATTTTATTSTTTSLGTTRTSTTATTTTTTTTTSAAVPAAPAWTTYSLVVFPPAVIGGFLVTLMLLQTSLPCKWPGRGGGGALQNCTRHHAKVSSREISRGECGYAVVGSEDRAMLAAGLVHHAAHDSGEEGNGCEEAETPGALSRAEAGAFVWAEAPMRPRLPASGGDGACETAGAAPGTRRTPPSKPNY